MVVAASLAALAVVAAVIVSLTLSNIISDVDDGDYSAVFTDSLGTVTSAAGKLTVLLVPTILQPNPAGQWLQLTAVVGENITLSTQIRGTKPIFIRWRRFGPGGGASILPSDRFVNVNTDFQVLNNISNLSAGAYTLIMTNSVGGSLGSARTNAILTVLAEGRNHHTDSAAALLAGSTVAELYLGGIRRSAP